MFPKGNDLLNYCYFLIFKTILKQIALLAVSSRFQALTFRNRIDCCSWSIGPSVIVDLFCGVLLFSNFLLFISLFLGLYFHRVGSGWPPCITLMLDSSSSRLSHTMLLTSERSTFEDDRLYPVVPSFSPHYSLSYSLGILIECRQRPFQPPSAYPYFVLKLSTTKQICIFNWVFNFLIFCLPFFLLWPTVRCQFTVVSIQLQAQS